MFCTQMMFYQMCWFVDIGECEFCALRPPSVCPSYLVSAGQVRRGVAPVTGAGQQIYSCRHNTRVI